jgi:hypothetical protein
MSLLGASVLAIVIGAAIVLVIVARLWMKLMWRLLTVVVALAALGAVFAVAWLWVAR